MAPRNLLLGLLTLGLCVGTSCLTPVPFDRLQPNDDLRQACSDEGMTDDDLAFALTTVERDRLSGYLKEQLIVELPLYICGETPTTGCVQCTLAIINQVYDYAP